ncbi:hypothetical protein [Sphingomonas agri]|uniref:hypothetical protein n=1 Tax=Sphingomonas agri TaxID=1813878 RepID=UPI00311E285E
MELDYPLDARQKMGAHAFAGITVPDTPVIRSAIEYARRKCEPYLFNHVMRSWLFAVRLGQLKSIPHDPEILAVGTLLHDVTLNESYAGPRRFEVEAADLVRSFASEAGMDDRRAGLIWDCVALNSTPSIGLYKQPEVALCTSGIGLDVVGFEFDQLPSSEIAAIVAEYPRLAMKQRFVRCFTHFAATHPETSYDNFVRDFGERFVSGYHAPSAVDWVLNAPFKE